MKEKCGHFSRRFPNYVAVAQSWNDGHWACRSV